MISQSIPKNRFLLGGLIALLLLGMAHGLRAETLDELYKKAVKEEGVLNFYCYPGADQRRKNSIRCSKSVFRGSRSTMSMRHRINSLPAR